MADAQTEIDLDSVIDRLLEGESACMRAQWRAGRRRETVYGALGRVRNGKDGGKLANVGFAAQWCGVLFAALRSNSSCCKAPVRPYALVVNGWVDISVLAAQ